MVMYENEFKTKENKIWTKDKIETRLRYYIERCVSQPFPKTSLPFVVSLRDREKS